MVSSGLVPSTKLSYKKKCAQHFFFETVTMVGECCRVLLPSEDSALFLVSGLVSSHNHVRAQEYEYEPCACCLYPPPFEKLNAAGVSFPIRCLTLLHALPDSGGPFSFWLSTRVRTHRPQTTSWGWRNSCAGGTPTRKERLSISR